MHATITDDARRQAIASREHGRTLLQFEALTRWGVAELMTGNRGRALGCAKTVSLSVRRSGTTSGTCSSNSLSPLPTNGSQFTT